MPALRQLQRRAKSFAISSLRGFDSRGSKAWACIELQFDSSSDDIPDSNTERQIACTSLTCTWQLSESYRRTAHAD